MANKYFVWKNGNPQEWEKLTGKEFYALAHSDAAKGRYFARVTGAIAGEETLFIEASKEAFALSCKEHKHLDYIIKRDVPFKVENFSALVEEDKIEALKKVNRKLQSVDGCGEDIDTNLNKELQLQMLLDFQKTLNEIDKVIFEHYVLNVALGKKKSITQKKLGKQLGISQGRLSQRKKRICELFVKECDLP